MADFDPIKDASIWIHQGSSTPVSIHGPVVMAEWCDLNEGLCGEYNPKDPEDIHFLRFDIYVKRDGDWEPVDDASYCTLVPADTDINTLVRLLYSIYKQYDNILSSNPHASVKKLGEVLSHTSVD